MFGALSAAEGVGSALALGAKWHPSRTETLETCAGALLILGFGLLGSALPHFIEALTANRSVTPDHRGNLGKVASRRTRQKAFEERRPGPPSRSPSETEALSRRAAWTIDPTLVIQLYDVFQGSEGSVVHVGRATCDVAQRRRLECVPQLFRARKQSCRVRRRRFVAVPMS